MHGVWKFFFCPGTLLDVYFVDLCNKKITIFGLNEIKDPIKMYLQDIFTVQANIAGIPAISIPKGNHTNNMPFGIQLMADLFEEEKLLACASYMMKELN